MCKRFPWGSCKGNSVYAISKALHAAYKLIRTSVYLRPELSVTESGDYFKTRLGRRRVAVRGSDPKVTKIRVTSRVTGTRQRHNALGDIPPPLLLFHLLWNAWSTIGLCLLSSKNTKYFRRSIRVLLFLLTSLSSLCVFFTCFFRFIWPLLPGL